MYIGYACIVLGIDAKTNRRLILKNFSEEKFLEIVKLNLMDLKRILEYNNTHNIKLFRISSDIIPLGSHDANDVDWQEYFKEELIEIGNYIKNNNMRVSMHPGQYTVLNSNNQETVDKSVKDLKYHADFLDSLQLDYTHKIILHIGGIYGDKNQAIKRFVDNFNKLSESIKKRLVIENDEKNYSISDVLKISKLTNIPVVFDNLHNECNIDKIEDIEEIMNEVIKTWRQNDGSVKVHYSQQDISKKKGAHSKTINTKEFLEYYNRIKKFKPDIMLEVKDKNISAVKCNNILREIDNKLDEGCLYDEWMKYKYLIVERGHKYYKHCIGMINPKCTIREFYFYIDDVLNSEINYKDFKISIECMWGYIENIVSKREKIYFEKLLYNEKDIYKVKNYFKKLCEKYSLRDILESYYFEY